MGSRCRFALLGEPDWLLARIAAAPDLIGQALRGKLAARGIKGPRRESSLSVRQDCNQNGSWIMRLNLDCLSNCLHWSTSRTPVR